MNFSSYTWGWLVDWVEGGEIFLSIMRDIKGYWGYRRRDKGKKGKMRKQTGRISGKTEGEGGKSGRKPFFKIAQRKKIRVKVCRFEDLTIWPNSTKLLQLKNLKYKNPSIKLSFTTATPITCSSSQSRIIPLSSRLETVPIINCQHRKISPLQSPYQQHETKLKHTKSSWKCRNRMFSK